jgi:hypothetical protein
MTNPKKTAAQKRADNNLAKAEAELKEAKEALANLTKDHKLAMKKLLAQRR